MPKPNLSPKNIPNSQTAGSKLLHQNDNKKAQQKRKRDIEDKENTEAKRLRLDDSNLSSSDLDEADEMPKFPKVNDQITQSINIDEAKNRLAQTIAPVFKEFKIFLNSSEGSDMFNILYKNQVHRNMSSILGKAKASAKQAFEDLYNLWFDENGEKTKYLRSLEKNGVNLSNISSILNGAGANAKQAFEDLYNLWFDENGPLPKTFADFWRMIWEQETQVIVMTTKTAERGRVKCGQYWPEENYSEDYGCFKVFNRRIECFADYTISYLVLTNETLGTSQDVVHMQFTSWPDYGVPHSAFAMLDFRDKVRLKQEEAVAAMGEHWKGHKLGPPIVVHCSAGIGRTGTFITLDICIKRLEDTGLIDIIKTVEKIRAQRAYSIQMPDQYVFCHLALLEYALTRRLLENVDLSGFNDDDSESE